MAKMFAISIFVTFLGARSMKNTSATPEPGYYCFAAYVLLSAIIANLFIKMNDINPSIT